MSNLYIKRIEITCWRSGRVLFSHEAENNTMRMTVEAAVNAGANLSGANLAWTDLSKADLGRADLGRANLGRADLYGADLSGADLYGAYLVSADLTDANLTDADLSRANLDSVYLTGANLTGANLTGANLAWAKLGGAYLYGADGEKITLVGSRPIIQIGPIGSDLGTLIAYLTDRGVYLSIGCFFGTREQFEAKMVDTHHDNIHAREYAAAMALVDAHVELAKGPQ